MKILFVIANLANGGAERVLAALSSELAKDNEIHIAVLEKDCGFYEFSENIAFHRLNFKGGGLGAKIAKILALRGLFKSVEPDLIISFIDWTNVICAVANFGLGCKHIATEHHANEYLKSPKFRFVRDLCYRRADGLSVLSKSDFEYYGFVKKREILHNPFFIKQNAQRNLRKENIILSVGRLEEVKDYSTYFRALAMIKPEILSGWSVQIAGEGGLEARLKKEARELGLDVEFLGHVKDVAPLYERAKIFVISSVSEGLSNALIEAGHFGCARVSSDTVGGRELIKNGVNGAIFEIGNASELARILSEILSDESLQKRLGEAAKADAGEFELENIMKKWRKFIDEVMRK